MPRLPASTIETTRTQRALLKAIIRQATAPQRLVERASIILMMTRKRNQSTTARYLQ